MNEPSGSTLDFYSKLIVISSGYAKDIYWHQYKEQFAVIKGVDKTGKFVEFVTEKKGFFGKSEYMIEYSDLSG